MSNIKDKQILLRVTPDILDSIRREAGKEKKSVTQYLTDAHISHCGSKYNRATTCPKCDAENVREKITCWNCGREY